jgi:two-component system, NarL family, nitrate/nitrite response regulator NarL
MDKTQKIAVFEKRWLMSLGMMHALTESEFAVSGPFTSADALKAALEVELPAAALIGLSSTDSEAAGLVEWLHNMAPQLPVVVLSTFAHEAIGPFCARWGVRALLDPVRVSREEHLAAIRGAIAGTHKLERSQLREEQDGLSRLSLREREVLLHVASGADNLKIAAVLGITERTVKAHVSALYRKLNLENRTELALLAVQRGLRLPIAMQDW